jgi:hypothetical protein
MGEGHTDSSERPLNHTTRSNVGLAVGAIKPKERPFFHAVQLSTMAQLLDSNGSRGGASLLQVKMRVMQEGEEEEEEEEEEGGKEGGREEEDGKPRRQ